MQNKNKSEKINKIKLQIITIIIIIIGLFFSNVYDLIVINFKYLIPKASTQTNINMNVFILHTVLMMVLKIFSYFIQEC